jgi:hypothetical protein
MRGDAGTSQEGAIVYAPGKREAWLAIVTLVVLAVLLATGAL